MQTLLERLPRPEATVTDQERVDQLLASVVDDTPSPWKYLPEAAHHPERDPSYLTEVDEICAVARAMGRHLMPWQYKALEVATEYRLDSFGLRRYHYGTVLITVPRQSGKTDLTVPLQVHRALTRTDPAAVWYTAQTGQDARKRMMEFLERVEESLLQLLLSSSRSNGAEGVKVRGKPGAHVTRFSPTFSALHGEHPHLVTMDEVWHFTKELGDALIGAIEPSQITLGSRAQMWMVSTMGTVASEWMNDYVDHGRAGDNPDLCYIEYSIPEGADPFDPKSWWLFHPALGNTIAEEDLAKRARSAQESAARRATWLRAYCNTLVASDGTLVDLAVWDDLAIDVEPPENTSEITLGIEVAPRNAAAAVSAAWTDARTGRPCVRIVHQAPGTSWLVPYVDDLAGQWGSPLAADSAGPSSRFVKALEDLGHDIRTLSMAEYGQATEALLDYAGADEVLIHDGSDELRAQMAGAEVRRSNGVRRFSRDGAVPTPALIGGAVALYAHEHPEVPTQTLLI
ncbi:hypothetical protein D3I60_00015 [Brevibacterium permense]|nr:hypothetical protein [Brevibacterium permense]